MNRAQRLSAAAGIFLALAPVPAAAHEAKSLALGFVGGWLHPLSGPDHLLAMVAVGLWGAFLGRPLIWLLPVVFPTIMAVGGVLGMAQLPFPPVEVGIALSVIVLGLAIATRWRAPVPLAVAIVALFGLFHGYAHGLELPSMANPVGFSLGFVMATGMLHIAGILIGLVRDRPGGETVLRAMGALIALAGAWFLCDAVQAVSLIA
ncbi:MAG: HupE/UreJ family protein [Croceibacterium sp.]